MSDNQPPDRREYHVSPNGDDGSPGTASAPFQTIQRARDAVREVNGDMCGDVVVYLAGGVYRIDDTIDLDHRDSGTNGHRVIYRNCPGQTPVISGGPPITGWRPDTGNRWRAETGLDNFRQLHVNGTRAVRARGEPPAQIEIHGDNGYRTTSAEMADWRNQSDIEFCYYTLWCHTRCKVSRITKDGPAALIEMLQPYFRIARTKDGKRVELPSYIENALELLTDPGQWYLDRSTGTVHYIPREGEDMTTAEVVAPAVETLLRVNGTLDNPVRDVHFAGITFADAGWLRPSEVGLVDMQANFTIGPEHELFEREVRPDIMGVSSVHNEYTKGPANVVCRAARGVRFEDCRFVRLGGAGVDLEYGSQDCAIAGCEFRDVAGSAIQVGDVQRDDHHLRDERAIVRNNHVINNHIHHAALDYQDGAGILVGYTDGTTISHNEINDLPYTGISIGWGWGEEDAGGGAYEQPFIFDTPTPMGNNICEYNHVHHVMQIVDDGGAVYTLSRQPGTVIRGNLIHDNKGMPGGIYLDEGSADIEITGNIVYNVKQAMAYNNLAQDRKATCNEHDNHFDVAPGEQGFPQDLAGRAGRRPLPTAGSSPPGP